jgi:hypothetical protein
MTVGIMLIIGLGLLVLGAWVGCTHLMMKAQSDLQRYDWCVQGIYVWIGWVAGSVLVWKAIIEVTK